MATAHNGELGLTGNPFVDTGLAVIAGLARLDDVESLTTNHMRRVHGDGGSLSTWNSSLKNFTMVLTKNSSLTNPSIKPESKRISMYRSVVNGLLSRIGHEELPFTCEACGAPKTLDFDRLCRSSLADVGAQEQTRFIGRDWFPLAGSMGSDAQALPAASRPVRLCARCLFVVHYLPLGLILLDGRLAVFQSTSIEFWYELVRDIVDAVQSRIKAGNFETLGTKEGSRALAKRLLGLFERLQAAGRFGGIPTRTSLHVWRFANSGASPECEIEEIPSAALVFLWKAVRLGLRHEVERFVDSEGKRERPFLRCIMERSDYRALYPRGKLQGASPKLFVLYRTEVCGQAHSALKLAHRLAHEAVQKLTPKDLKRLQREEAFSEPAIRNYFRNLVAGLAERGDVRLDDYIQLFPYTEGDRGIEVRFDGWNLVRYYLHYPGHAPEHLGDDLLAESSPSPNSNRLRYCAARVISEYVGKRGKARFQAEVLDRMRRGVISAQWLQKQFVSLAEEEPGFTYEAWERLSRQSDGRITTRELLFQMRLLWIQWMNHDGFPTVTLPQFGVGSGLPTVVEKRLRETVSHYVERRGLARFRRDVLILLRKSDAALNWFRHQLTREAEWLEGKPLSQGDWEDFLKDDEGHLRASERLFQMQLILANTYRDFTSKPEGSHEQ